MAIDWEEIVYTTLRCRMGTYRRWPCEDEQDRLVCNIIKRSAVKMLEAIGGATDLMVDVIQDELTKIEYQNGLR